MAGAQALATGIYAVGFPAPTSRPHGGTLRFFAQISLKVIAPKRVNLVKFFSIITLDMVGRALYNGAEHLGINRAMDKRLSGWKRTPGRAQTFR
jgi:hypothetical protein